MGVMARDVAPSSSIQRYCRPSSCRSLISSRLVVATGYGNPWSMQDGNRIGPGAIKLSMW